MKVINVNLCAASLEAHIIFDNRIPFGKAIQINDNTLSMSVATFEFMCDVSYI